MSTTITPPACPFCRATMVLLPTDDVRDRIDQCGYVSLPAQSFECVCRDCRARGVVTTVHTGEMPKLMAAG